MASQASDAERTSSRTWIALGVLGAVALFYLIAEHRAHLLGWLPYLILLACPVMHLFMHRGHSHAEGRAPGARSGSHPHDDPNPGQR